VAISEWPMAQRPRERLLRLGAAALSDAELVAIVLRTGRQGESALIIAQRLLESFGSLTGLLDAAPQSLLAQPGTGLAFYAQLQAGLELAQRRLENRLRESAVFNSPGDTRTFLRHKLRAREREVFAALFLDNRHQLLAYEELFFGTIDCASVHPREVVKRALTLNAAALIVAHNHPSGSAEPSSADCSLTERLRDALGLVEIRLLDHLVVGSGEAVSLAERGWI
jgi:DNA repair protein RadC